MSCRGTGSSCPLCCCGNHSAFMKRWWPWRALHGKVLLSAVDICILPGIWLLPLATAAAVLPHNSACLCRSVTHPAAVYMIGNDRLSFAAAAAARWFAVTPSAAAASARMYSPHLELSLRCPATGRSGGLRCCQRDQSGVTTCERISHAAKASMAEAAAQWFPRPMGNMTALACASHICGRLTHVCARAPHPCDAAPRIGTRRTWLE